MARVKSAKKSKKINSELVRWCPKCETPKDLTKENFYICKGVFQFWCKACVKKYNHEKNQQAAFKRDYKVPWKPLNTDTQRQCGQCFNVFDLTNEFFHKKGAGLSYTCKTCAIEIVTEKRKEAVDKKWEALYE